MYDLSQIPYVYTVEMTNRFNRLDLIEDLKNYGQRLITLWQPKPCPQKRNTEDKKVFWGGLTNTGERRRKRQKTKEKIYPTECRVPKDSTER